MARLAILGGGNMGEAIIAGLIRLKAYLPNEITVTDVRAEQRQALEKQYGVRTTDSNLQAIQDVEQILLAVKPQILGDLLSEIASHIKPTQLIISIAAGIPIRFIEKKLSGKNPVVRVMPNTPALIGQGAAGVAGGTWASQEHIQKVLTIFETVGIALHVPENQIDAVTAVSGSGPAYLFYLAEGMMQAAQAQGLSAEVADQLVRQTLKGASLLLGLSKDQPDTLRKRVTSPGGTTEQAILHFETQKTKDVISEAIRRAAARAGELAQQYAPEGGSKA